MEIRVASAPGIVKAGGKETRIILLLGVEIKTVEEEGVEAGEEGLGLFEFAFARLPLRLHLANHLPLNA